MGSACLRIGYEGELMFGGMISRPNDQVIALDDDDDGDDMVIVKSSSSCIKNAALGRAQSSQNDDVIIIEDDHKRQGDGRLGQRMEKALTIVMTNNPRRWSLQQVKAVIQMICEGQPSLIDPFDIANEALVELFGSGGGGDSQSQLYGDDSEEDLVPRRPTAGSSSSTYPPLTDLTATPPAPRTKRKDAVVVIDATGNTQTISSSSSSSSSSVKSLHRPPTMAQDIIEQPTMTPLEEVLRIFPDAATDAVNALLRKNIYRVDVTIQTMLDEGYEKVKVKVKPNTAVGTGSGSGSSSTPAAPQIDFTSSSWETSAAYRTDAIVELCNNFPFIKTESIKGLFRKEKHHYYHTLKKIEEMTGIKARMNIREKYQPYFVIPAESIITIRERLDKSYKDLKVQTRATARNITQPKDIVDDPTLQTELLWVSKKRLVEIEQEDKKVAEELNYQLAQNEGALLECGCCYAEHPFESLIQCSEGHLFCKECLQRYAEQVLFGDGRSVLKCMNTSEQCTGTFTESMLRASLPEKVLAKYSEALMRDVLKAAHVENIVNCHNCSFQAEMAENMGHVLHCPDCGLDTCKLCGDQAHIPLKCSEVEKKKDTAKRVSVEEAMTQARVRECPRCHTRFYKTEGCNKMTCSCGAFICYCCREDITKQRYEHFCKVPHCRHNNCGKCKLFTDSVEDDRRAMLDAGLKTLKEFEAEEKEATEQGDNLPKNEVRPEK